MARFIGPKQRFTVDYRRKAYPRTRAYYEKRSKRIKLRNLLASAEGRRLYNKGLVFKRWQASRARTRKLKYLNQKFGRDIARNIASFMPR